MIDYSDILYAMFAMVLFSILVINTNSAILRNEIFLVESELENTAIALSQGVLEEARSKRYDEATLGDPDAFNIPFPVLSKIYDQALVPSSFTSPSELGPESGEVYPAYNDFDDFNGLQLDRTTDHGEYVISVEVYYVQRDSPDVPASQRTEHKRMDVFVTSDYFDHTVNLSYIKSF